MMGLWPTEGAAVRFGSALFPQLGPTVDSHVHIDEIRGYGRKQPKPAPDPAQLKAYCLRQNITRLFGIFSDPAWQDKMDLRYQERQLLGYGLLPAEIQQMHDNAVRLAERSGRPER